MLGFKAFARVGVIISCSVSCGSRSVAEQVEPAASRAPIEIGSSETSGPAGGDTTSSDKLCSTAGKEYGASLSLRASEMATASDVAFWETYRNFYAGVTENSPFMADVDATELVAVCVFASDELQVPGPPGKQEADTLIATVAPGGNLHVESMGAIASIKFPLPADLSRSGFVPPKKPAVVGTATDRLAVVASDGVSHEVAVTEFDGGFCFGIPEPETCLEAASLDGFGPIFAQEFLADKVLVSLVRKDVATMVVHLSNEVSIGEKIDQNAVFVSSRVLVVTPLPFGVTVIGTQGFDRNGAQIS